MSIWAALGKPLSQVAVDQLLLKNCKCSLSHQLQHPAFWMAAPVLVGLPQYMGEEKGVTGHLHHSGFSTEAARAQISIALVLHWKTRGRSWWLSQARWPHKEANQRNKGQNEMRIKQGREPFRAALSHAPLQK